MDVNAEGQRLDGKIISGKIKQNIKDQMDEILKSKPNFKPGLAIVQVGNREDSNVYCGMKIKTGTELGFDARHVKLPNTITEDELLIAIEQLNNDGNIHGIIVQQPLDCVENIDSAKCTNAVSTKKDVDGLHEISSGRLSRGELSKCFHCCTPKGCMQLIRETGIDIEGKHAVVIGRSKIVGSPMANMLTWANATVTICHSRTKNLEEMVKLGDIIVAACGQKELIKGSWIKPGAVVIDCGINVVPDSTRKSGRRLIGDVEFAEAKKLASWITPVPGGVGPMTVAMLMENTLESAKQIDIMNGHA